MGLMFLMFFFFFLVFSVPVCVWLEWTMSYCLANTFNYDNLNYLSFFKGFKMQVI